MIATISHKDSNFTIDLSQPIDISLPITASDQNPIAWYIEKPVIEPVKMGDWIGKVSSGSSTNFNNITFNPHGHGTHTECLGHITKDFYSINKALKNYFFIAELITIIPERNDKDLVINRSQIENAIEGRSPEALIIRTLPNDKVKMSKKYSNTNPPYLDEEAATFIREMNIEHLLVDMPSVDRERDEGRLLAHKAFWNVTNTEKLNQDARMHATITEMIYANNDVPDGRYLLNLQIASFENDASPSKPVLYKIEK